jgi:hypothetical protein
MEGGSEKVDHSAGKKTYYSRERSHSASAEAAAKPNE